MSTPLSDNTVDCFLATEVFEHCCQPEVTLEETWRVLKLGGLLFLIARFLWSLHDVSHDEDRYTSCALERVLRNAGFRQIELPALGGWDARLAQMIGLWIRRHPMPYRVRIVLSALALPFVRLLWSWTKFQCSLERFKLPGIAGAPIKPSV